MDKEIFDKLCNYDPPFNGGVIHFESPISLEELRLFTSSIIEFLRNEHLIHNEVYHVWDWLEHDGYLSKKKVLPSHFLDELVSNDETLYSNRSGDTYVRLGLFDPYSNWYMRIYIIDDFDLENSETRSEYFDVSLSWSNAEKMKVYLMSKHKLEFSLDSSGDYFEKIRA